MSEGDLPSFVYNFVRTRDCFLNASPRLSVRVDLTILLPSTIIAEVAWNPPNIDFGVLPMTLNVGALIHPEYFPPNCGNSYGFVSFPDLIEYTIDNDPSSLPVK